MHRSRLAGFIIDCQNTGREEAARFWGSALGLKSLGPEGDKYVVLDGAARDLHVLVQTVDHASRVHLDIETDDVAKEVARLETLGARRVEQRGSWWIMEAPTGQRFCVVPGKNLVGAAGVTEWK